MAEQGIKVVISTVYYLQTDGQTERLNQTLEQYLKHYINHIQHNQALLLLAVQFIYNAILQKGIGMLLFKANYGYKLKILLLLQQAKKSSEIAKKRVKTFINLYKDFQESAKVVQKCIKRYYNLKVSEGLDFKEGDKVLLLYKNILSR